MKLASLGDSRRGPAQIWNSAPQLAQIPPIAPTSLVTPGARVVIVAPHPGDEVLACGGLLQSLSTLEHPLKLISITDGSASHPGSDVWPARRLSVVRPQESAEALRRLGMPLHIFKCPIRGWVAKCPSRYGSLRGFGDTPVDAYKSLRARYALHGVGR